MKDYSQIINEAGYQFKIGHGSISRGKKDDFETVIIPKIERNKNYDYEYLYKGAIQVNFPIGAKFVVWNDPYHGKIHLNALCEFIGNVVYDDVDFEDIDYDLIVGTFDNLADAAKFMQTLNEDDIYDSERFLEDAATGVISDKDYCLNYYPDVRKNEIASTLIDACINQNDVLIIDNTTSQHTRKLSVDELKILGDLYDKLNS